MATTALGTATLELRRTIAASPETLFDARTKPHQLRRWFAPNPGMEMPDVELDPRVGGAWMMSMLVESGEPAW